MKESQKADDGGKDSYKKSPQSGYAIQVTKDSCICVGLNLKREIRVREKSGSMR
jgi:hypothetical protein